VLPRRHLLSRIVGRVGSNRLNLEWLARSERKFGEREYALLPYLVDPLRPSVDIGAAEGAYTYWLSKVSIKVVALEPNPESFRCLKEAFRLFPNVELLNVAVSSSEGEVTLRVPVVRTGRDGKSLALSGWGTIDHRNQFLGLSCVATVEHRVHAVRPSRVIPEDVGFIKIDVEGHEYEVLSSMPETVWHVRPCFLIEVGDSSRGSSLADVYDLLSSKNYTVLALSPRGLRRISRSYSPDPSGNLIAIPGG
jgi:FkbM family methyltransferase